MNKENYINQKLAEIEKEIAKKKKATSKTNLELLLISSFFGAFGITMLTGGLVIPAAAMLTFSGTTLIARKHFNKVVENYYKNKKIEKTHLENVKNNDLVDDINTNNKRKRKLKELRQKKKLVKSIESKNKKVIIGSLVALGVIEVLFPSSLFSIAAFFGELVFYNHQLKKIQELKKTEDITNSRIANLENDLAIIRGTHSERSEERTHTRQPERSEERVHARQPERREERTSTRQPERRSTTRPNQERRDNAPQMSQEDRSYFNSARSNNTSARDSYTEDLDNRANYYINLQKAMVDNYINNLENRHNNNDNTEIPLQKAKS